MYEYFMNVRFYYFIMNDFIFFIYFRFQFSFFILIDFSILLLFCRLSIAVYRFIIIDHRRLMMILPSRRYAIKHFDAFSCHDFPIFNAVTFY